MSDLEKTCPECAETVKAGAKLCRFCGFRWDAGVQPFRLKGGPPVPAQKKPAPAKPDGLQVLQALLTLGAIGFFVWFMMKPTDCSGEKPAPSQVAAPAAEPAAKPEPDYDWEGDNCLIEFPNGPMKQAGWEGMIPIALKPRTVPKSMNELGAIIHYQDRVTTHELDGFSRRVTINKDPEDRRREGWVPMEWLRCPPRR